MTLFIFSRKQKTTEPLFEKKKHPKMHSIKCIDMLQDLKTNATE